LLAAGYWVQVARDGVEGLAAIESEAQPFDLIVTDLMMPRIGGLALARRLSESGRKPRVLFISGYTHDAPSEIAPYGKLLTKPFTPGVLLAAVADALGEHAH
jgi:CheY-like chemotaxis protein